ncbi:hypothetical protein JCM11641_000058 [Rhodosporidiobolus odoratus]
MDSYPQEFVAHPRPLLYLALDQPPSTPDTPQDTPGPPPTDPFDILRANLRRTFASKKGFPLWDNSQGANNDFHCLVVDKYIRFPPLKARPTSTAQQPPPALHSPISPLTPTSPLYPDGIIAPIWIRKHRELVPSVFILVLRLFEHEPGQSTHTPLDPSEREEEERQHDAELVREIVDRKRSTLERGIKLAVVLLCSRALLDDPALDFRLSLIRRQSGLDSRASLFVISPVPQTEVANFVQSIRAELYPSAVDYYREHGRRTRRKRARQVSKGGLHERGWNVRSDYKLGFFAEMRGETEVSLKHYEDCYDSLTDMFAQPGLLPQRTKRWAEAKVLADCVSVKVSKLYLYLNDPSRALARLNQHVYRFRELSNSWQIGEETFEFWSWLSKQYRLFGDLTAVALRNGFRLPSLKPPPTPRAPPPGTSPSQLPSPGLMPLNVLQHAGHYYHLAAVCAVERRDRFRATKAALMQASDLSGTDALNSPALVHEQKVEHADLIIELYTKAYEFFKANKAKNMTYFIAAQIASAHLENGKHDMAFRFYDRISKNYRRGWRDLLDSILVLSFRSAVKTEDWESAIRIGMELLAPTSRISVEKRAEHATEVLEIVRTKTPTSPEKAAISLDMSESAALLDCRLSFWSPSVHVSELVPFQLVLASPPTSRSSGFAFSQLDIHFNDDRPPVTVYHEEASSSSLKPIQQTVLGNVTQEGEKKASLIWEDGSTKVFSGAIACDKEVDILVEKVVLTAHIGSWQLSLTLKPDPTTGKPVWYIKEQAMPLERANRVCRIIRRELRTIVSTHFEGPAYLGEEFPVSVEVVNEDDCDVQVFLVLFLQPGDEGVDNRVLVDDQSSASIVESLSLGSLAPGASLSKTFDLSSRGPPGIRHVDVTIRAIPTLSADESSSSSPSLLPAAIPSPTEVTRTLSIPAIQPFGATFDTQLYPKRRPVKPLLDLTEPDGWEGASEAALAARLQAVGPSELEVLAIQVDCENAPSLRVVESSIGATPLTSNWRPGELFNAAFRLDVKPQLSDEESVVGGAILSVLWRRAGSSAQITTSLPLPPIKAASLLPAVMLQLPPYLVLHQPSTLTYRFSNPTGRVLTLSSQIDSPEVPSSFVFAGPRRFPEWILAPNEERELQVRVVPLTVGYWPLPRLRVWEVEQPPPVPNHALVDEEGRPLPPPPPAQPKLHELEVQLETEATFEPDPVQVELEADLRSARGGDEDDAERPAKGKAPVVLVLPR